MTSVRWGPRATAGFAEHGFCASEAGVPSLRDLFPPFLVTRDFRPGLSHPAPSGLAVEACEAVRIRR